MKLPTRKGKAEPLSGDHKKMRTIRLRLNRVSETVRTEQIKQEVAKKSAPAKARVTVTQMPAKTPGLVRVKITRKGGAVKNLTLNSAKPAGGLVTAPATSPAVVSDELTWKARRMHGRHLPVLQCNNCSISRVCPKFKAGYECAFLPYLNSHKVEDANDLMKYMKIMVGNSMKRAQLMSIIETANGGMPSVETSEALDMAFRQLKELHGVMTDTGEESVEIEGEATIVGSIFGGMKLEQVVEETSNMKKQDPMLALPDVPLAADDVRAVQPADVSEELIRDAMLGSSSGQQAKKDLPRPVTDTIAQSELTKAP